MNLASLSSLRSHLHKLAMCSNMVLASNAPPSLQMRVVSRSLD